MMGLTEFANRVGATPEAVAKAARGGAAGRIPSVRLAGDRWEFNEQCIEEWNKSKGVAEIYNRNAVMPPGMRGGRPPGRKMTNGSAGLRVDGNGQDGVTDQERYLKVRIQGLGIKALLDKQKLDKGASELINKADVEKRAAEFGAVLLQKLENIPVRHAAVLAAMTDEFEVKKYLKKAMNEAIREVRNECGYPTDIDS